MRNTFTLAAVCTMVLAACTAPDTTSPSATGSLRASASWGPETPNFNNEIVLRGAGFGLVKFRQPNDGSLVVYLDTWIRDLTPNTAYNLQRAVDTNIDDDCTSTAWLTLGKGTTPQSITTDARGAGQEDLFRDLTAVGVGGTFDIHFRVVNATTSAVVLTSECYQFTVSQ